MKISRLGLAVCVALVLGTSTVLAGQKGPVCSPGFYGHRGLELWYPCDTIGGVDCETVLAMLNANGQTHDKPGQVKNEAALLIENALGTTECKKD